MKKSIEEIYVHILESGLDGVYKFDVKFPDGCQKSFKASQIEFLAARCSFRDFIEVKIIEFYEDSQQKVPKFVIYFI